MRKEKGRAARLSPLPQAGEGQGEGQGEGLQKTYSLYSLIIRSPLPLPAPLLPNSEAANWTAHWAEPKLIRVRPPRGRLLAEHHFNKTVGYAHAQAKNTVVLRYFGTCEFRCDRAARRIAVHVDPRAPAGYAATLLAGSVPACLLALAGETVLHASAVTKNGAAIAFVGYSGAGKSTLAAMACAVGARLLTDDVLRLDPAAAALRCYPGANELRLRPKAAELAATANVQQSSETPDGRTAIRPLASDETRPPLSAVVLPRPQKEQTALCVRRLPPSEALTALLACPRVLGWRDHRLGANELPLLARLVRTVPVYQATVP